MKLMTIQVPNDSVEFVEEFVERIGGSVDTKEEEKNEHRTAHGKKVAAKKKLIIPFCLENGKILKLMPEK